MPEEEYVPVPPNVINRLYEKSPSRLGPSAPGVMTQMQEERAGAQRRLRNLEEVQRSELESRGARFGAEISSGQAGAPGTRMMNRAELERRASQVEDPNPEQGSDLLMNVAEVPAQLLGGRMLPRVPGLREAMTSLPRLTAARATGAAAGGAIHQGLFSGAPEDMAAGALRGALGEGAGALIARGYTVSAGIPLGRFPGGRFLPRGLRSQSFLELQNRFFAKTAGTLPGAARAMDIIEEADRGRLHGPTITLGQATRSKLYQEIENIAEAGIASAPGVQASRRGAEELATQALMDRFKNLPNISPYAAGRVLQDALEGGLAARQLVIEGAYNNFYGRATSRGLAAAELPIPITALKSSARGELAAIESGLGIVRTRSRDVIEDLLGKGINQRQVTVVPPKTFGGDSTLAPGKPPGGPKQFRPSSGPKQVQGEGFVDVGGIYDRVFQEDVLPLRTAAQLRSDLLTLSRISDEKISPPTQALAKRLAGQLDDAMAKVMNEADASGSLLRDFRRAGRLVELTHETYNEGAIGSLFNQTTPEKVMRLGVQNAEASDIARLRGIVTKRDREMLNLAPGQPSPTWEKVQGSYIHELLLNAERPDRTIDADGLLMQLRRPAAIGPHRMKALWGEPERRAIEENVRAIGLAQSSAGQGQFGSVAIRLTQSGMVVSGVSLLGGSVFAATQDREGLAGALAGGAVVVFMGPRLLGRLVSNRQTVRLLTGLAKAPVGSRSATVLWGQFLSHLELLNRGAEDALTILPQGTSLSKRPDGRAEVVLDRESQLAVEMSTRR